MVVDIPDVITYANFGYHRLRGFWAAGGGQISLFPIGFHRHVYNTVAVACECVMVRTAGVVWTTALSAQQTLIN